METAHVNTSCSQTSGTVRHVQRSFNINVLDALLFCWSCREHFMVMLLTLLVPVILKHLKYLMLTDFGPNINVKNANRLWSKY